MTSQKKWQAACCFQITQKLGQSCCCNEEKNETRCFFFFFFSGRFQAATIQHSQWENTSFSIRPYLPGSHKQISLHFQSFVKTYLGNNVPFHEKRGQERVFFQCWQPCLFLPRLCEMVLSGDFWRGRSGKQPVSLENWNIDESERVRGRKARGLQMEDIGYKYLLKFCVAWQHLVSLELKFSQTLS